jgi:hypothetical protein
VTYTANVNCRALACVLAVSCNWLPPDSKPQPPAPTDRDLAALAHVWIVENHVLAGNAAIGHDDALKMHGRKVELTATSYTTPFGSCEDASREKRERVFADLLARLDLSGESRGTAIRFGFGDPITEYKLSCAGNRHTVPVTIYISGDRAMTCFGGACYLLAYK